MYWKLFETFMANLNRTSSLSNLDNAIVTSPELVCGPDNKKRKTMMENTSKNGQTTLDFGQRAPRSPLKSNKSREFKLLCNKIDDMKFELNTTLKQVVKVTDLDERLKVLVTKNELSEYVEQATMTLREENEELKGRLLSVEIENDGLQSRLSRLEQDSELQKGNLNSAHYKGDYCREGLNDLEQHGRANSIRIYGVGGRLKESALESVRIAVSVINSRLGLHISEADVDIAHRIPHFNKNNKNPQAIIVKFVRRMVKLEVMANRSKLKHSKIVIKEDLTMQNTQMMDAVYRRDDVKSTWSSGGKIFAKLKDESVQCIQSDLQQRVKNFQKSASFGQHLPSPSVPRMRTSNFTPVEPSLINEATNANPTPVPDQSPEGENAMDQSTPPTPQTATDQE